MGKISSSFDHNPPRSATTDAGFVGNRQGFISLLCSVSLRSFFMSVTKSKHIFQLHSMPQLLPIGFVVLSGCMALTGCQPVPLSSSSQQQSPRPVEPLYKESANSVRPRPQDGFQVASTQTNSQKQSGKTDQKNNVDVAQLLADAADKAASAKSLAQSAQTKDDWNLVFDRWKRAIKILRSAPTATATVKQKITEYNSGLVQATRDAKVSLNPSLAPVDPTGNEAIKTLIGIQGDDPKADPKENAPESANTDTPAPDQAASPEKSAEVNQPDATTVPSPTPTAAAQ